MRFHHNRDEARWLEECWVILQSCIRCALGKMLWRRQRRAIIIESLQNPLARIKFAKRHREYRQEQVRKAARQKMEEIKAVNAMRRQQARAKKRKKSRNRRKSSSARNWKILWLPWRARIDAL